jgi:hypothetical protein
MCWSCSIGVEIGAVLSSPGFKRSDKMGKVIKRGRGRGRGRRRAVEREEAGAGGYLELL